MFSALAPARRRLILGLLAAGIAAVLTLAVVVIAIGMTLGRHGIASAVPQDKPGPVLLVPGYGGSITSLATLATRLRAQGKDVEVVTLSGNAQGDLRQQASELAAAATAALVRTGAESVDVVGYSAGGVVARLWVRDYGGSTIARRVVTLGSPQHGTQLAQLGALFPSQCPLACQQLGPGSELLNALNQGSETPKGPSFVSIWTTRDEVVLPADSARLRGAINIVAQDVCASSHVQHGGLPTDPLIMAMVGAELTANPTVQLAAQDCRRLSS